MKNVTALTSVGYVTPLLGSQFLNALSMGYNSTEEAWKVWYCLHRVSIDLKGSWKADKRVKLP